MITHRLIRYATEACSRKCTQRERESVCVCVCVCVYMIKDKLLLVIIVRLHLPFDIHMSVHSNIITNYSQQDASFLEFIYFYRRFTCFKWFLRPSSGAHNCTYSFRYCQPILLLAATVQEVALT